MPPRTVIYVRTSVGYGGAEEVILAWLDSIDKNAFRCPVALFNNKNDSEKVFAEKLRERGHTILPLPWGKRHDIFAAVTALARHIREQNAVVVHTHDWRSDLVGYLGARRAGVPVMNTVHGWIGRPLKVFVQEAIDTCVIPRFDLLSVVSRATIAQTIAKGVDPKKCELLYAGIDTGAFEPLTGSERPALRAGFNLADSDIAYVYVARLSPEKGHSLLLEAFSDALGECGNLKLFLWGNGPLKEQLIDYAEKLGIGKSVVIPGFVTGVLRGLAAMDVLAHPSFAEGLPKAIYEGMLVGLPVIGTDVGGISEMVIPGRTGWIIPPRNRNELARVILESATRADLRKEFGSRARDLVLKEFNMRKSVEKLESLYSYLASRKQGK